MKNKGFALILVLALILTVGIALGVSMNVRRGEVERLRDAAQTENSALQVSIDEAQTRLKDLSESIPQDQSDDKTKELNQITAQNGYRADEVSLLQESLNRTREEIEKLTNTVEARLETLTERDNMYKTLEKDRQALIDEFNELADAEEAPEKARVEDTLTESAPIVTPEPTSADNTTVFEAPETERATDPLASEIIVAQVGDREITYAQLMESFEQYIPQYEDKYDLTDSSTVRMLMLDELNYIVELVIVTEWATELGIAETVESFAGSAESFYNSLLEHKTESFLDQGAKDEEEAREQAVVYLEKHHYTIGHIAQIMLNEDMNKRIKAYYADLATPTDEDLRAEYDRLVADAKERYEQSPAAFEYDIVNADPVYYYPSGYRVVRHILFLFDGEEQLEAGQLLNERAELEPDDARIPEIDARIDELRLKYSSRVTEIEDEYKNGASFDDLIERMGEDSGMQEGLTSERGYYVSAEMTVFESNFRDGAMAIENVGELSPPIVSGYGVHIIRYERDAEEGPADFDSIKDQLTSAYTAQRKESEYQKAYDEWTKQHPVIKYQDRVIAALGE